MNIIEEFGPGRYVVQSHSAKGSWIDDEAFQSLEDAREYAKRNADLFVSRFRIVDKGE